MLGAAIKHIWCAMLLMLCIGHFGQLAHFTTDVVIVWPETAVSPIWGISLQTFGLWPLKCVNENRLGIIGQKINKVFKMLIRGKITFMLLFSMTSTFSTTESNWLNQWNSQNILDFNRTQWHYVVWCYPSLSSYVHS